MLFAGGGGTLNPLLHRYGDPKSVTAVVEAEFKVLAEKIARSGVVAFGEMAGLHISAMPGHPYEFVPADHPLMKVLADVAARFDIPIDWHMDALEHDIPTPERFVPADNPAMLPATLPAFARLLAYNPKARIVWAHGAADPLGHMTPQRIGALMDRFDNLHVSLRVAAPPAPAHNKIMEFGGLNAEWLSLLTRHSDRFVIGSDNFYPAPNLHGRKGAGISFSQRNNVKLRFTQMLINHLDPALARKLATLNARRIYRLGGR